MAGVALSPSCTAQSACSHDAIGLHRLPDVIHGRRCEALLLTLAGARGVWRRNMGRAQEPNPTRCC